MTRADFEAAAREGTRVRLKDRSRCNYRNEWYAPRAEPDGALFIDTHTGESRTVDAELLAALRLQEQGPTVGDAIAALETLDRRMRLVLADGDGFVDWRRIETTEIAVEACSDRGSDRHGPTAEASGEDPVEQVAVMRGRGE
ncbi:MAG: hypothetical protein OXG04_26945 [Acidobacteria bacterium]|nr:hypothetical protein [Acidobacteriota bacterium]